MGDDSRAWEDLASEVIGCRRCPRLVAWCQQVATEKRRAFQDWEYWGKPVPGWGDRKARLVIVGLAPAAHGANRTGRMFTGDSSATTLMSALYRAGFASQPTSTHQDDGLEFRDAYITAVARCAPPGNHLTPEELSNCRPFLARELVLLTAARVVLALGKVAFDGYLRLLREQGHVLPSLAFGHGVCYSFDPPLPALVASYHPSRQNTQTGRLTDKMLDDVFEIIHQLLVVGIVSVRA